MSSPRQILLVTALLSLAAACGGSDDGASEVIDATTDRDALTGDAGAADAPAIDAGRPDAAVDCEFIDLDYFYVVCGEAYQMVRHWVRVGGPDPACTPYYTIGNASLPTYPTLEAAIASQSCDAACVWTPFQSVSVLCEGGGRSGWEKWRTPEDICPPIYVTGQGIYTDIEVWREMYCPAPPEAY